jgi:hypothetical protein
MSSLEPTLEPEEEPMHPLLAADVARQRIDACHQRAEQRHLATPRLRGPGAAVRIAVGSRLIAVGCRLFLSGQRERSTLPSG